MTTAVAVGSEARATQAQVAAYGGQRREAEPTGVAAEMMGKWMAALARAQRGQVRILAGPTVRSDSALCWRVTSVSEPEHPHLVVESADGVLTCSCSAGERPGTLCTHRAVVLGQLLARALIGASGGARRVTIVRAPRRSRLSTQGARRLAAAVLTSGSPDPSAPS